MPKPATYANSGHEGSEKRGESVPLTLTFEALGSNATLDLNPKSVADAIANAIGELNGRGLHVSSVNVTVKAVGGGARVNMKD